MWYALGAGAIAAAVAGAFWALGQMNQAAGEQARRERLARYQDGTF